MDSSRKDIKYTPKEDTPKAPDPSLWLRKQEKAPSSSAVDSGEKTSDAGKRSRTDPSIDTNFLSKRIEEFLKLGNSNPPKSKRVDASQSQQPSPLPGQERRSPDISASSAAHDGQFKTEPPQIGPRERTHQNETLTVMPVGEVAQRFGVEQTTQHDNQASPEVISQQLSDHAARWQEATGKVNKLKEHLEYTQQMQRNILHELEKYPEYKQHTTAEWQKRYDMVEKLENAYITASPGAQKREDALLDLENVFGIESGTAREETFKSKKREIELEIDAHIKRLGDSKGLALSWSKCIEEKERIQTQLVAETDNRYSVLTEYQNVLKQYHPVSPSHTSSREVLSLTQQQAFPIEPHPNELDVLAQVQIHQESRNNELREKEAKVAADEKTYYALTEEFQKVKEMYESNMKEVTKEGTFPDVSKISDTTKEHRNTIVLLTDRWKQSFELARDQSLQEAIETGEIPKRIRERKDERKRERDNLQAEIQSREARERFLEEHVGEKPEVGAQPMIDLSFGGVGSLEHESPLYVPESSQGPRGETSGQEEAAARERVIRPGELEALDTKIAKLDASLNELRQATTAIDEQIKILPDTMTNSLREKARLQEQKSQNESTKKIALEQYKNALDERNLLLRIQQNQDRQRGVTTTDDQEGAATTALIEATEQHHRLSQQKAGVTTWLALINDTLIDTEKDKNVLDEKKRSLAAKKVILEEHKETVGRFERKHTRLSEKLNASEDRIAKYSQQIQQIQQLQPDSSRKLINRSTIPEKGELTALVLKAQEEKNQLTRELTKLKADWNKQFGLSEAVRLDTDLFQRTRNLLDGSIRGLNQSINSSNALARIYEQEFTGLKKAQETALSDQGEIDAKLALVSEEYTTAEMRTRSVAKPQGTQEAYGAGALVRGENRARLSIEANREEFSTLTDGQEKRAQEIEKLVPTHEDFENLTRAREDLQNLGQAERTSERLVQELDEREKELLAVKSDLDKQNDAWESRMQAFEARDDAGRTDAEYVPLIKEGEQWLKDNRENLQKRQALQEKRVQSLARQKVVREQRALASKNYEDIKNVISEKLEQTEREIQQQLQSLETRESRLTALKSEIKSDQIYLEKWTKKYSESLDEVYSVGIVHDAEWQKAFKQRWVTWKNAELKPGEEPYGLEAGQSPRAILDREYHLLKARREEWSSRNTASIQVSEQLAQERAALAARQREHERAQALVKAQEGDILAAEFQRLETRQEQLDISWQEIETDQAHLIKRINDWNEFIEEGKSKSINDETWRKDFSRRWVIWKNAERAPEELQYTLEPEPSPIMNAVTTENDLLQDRRTKWQERFDNHQKDTQQLAQERAALTARQREHERAQALVEAQERDILTDKLRRLEVWESKLDAAKQAIDNDKRALSLQARTEQYNAFEQEFQENKGGRADLVQRWSNWKNAELSPDKDPYRLEANQSLQSALEQEKATLDTKRKQWEATDKKLLDNDLNYAFFSDRTKKYDALVQKFKENEQWEIGFKQRWVTWKNVERSPQEEPYRLEVGQSLQSALNQEKAALDDLQAEWRKGYQQILDNKNLLHTERARLLARQSQLERESGVAPDRDMQAEKVVEEAEYIRGLQAQLASLRKELSPEYQSQMQKEEELQQAVDSKKRVDSERGELQNARDRLRERYAIYEAVQVEFKKIQPEAHDLQDQLDRLNKQWEERKIGSPILLEEKQSQVKGKGKIASQFTPDIIFTNDLKKESELLASEERQLQERSLSLGQKDQALQKQQESLIAQQATNIASVTNKDFQAKLREYSEVLTALRRQDLLEQPVSGTLHQKGDTRSQLLSGAAAALQKSIRPIP